MPVASIPAVPLLHSAKTVLPPTELIQLTFDIRKVLHSDDEPACKLQRIYDLVSAAERPEPLGGILVISRREGESVMIDKNVAVSFGGMKGSNEGRLLIRARRHVSVVREELLQ